MFLRKLTDDEIEKIKKSKDAANKIIKERRKKLLAEIKPYKKRLVYNKLTLERLNQQLKALTEVTGLPVIIKDENRSIYVNYTLLKKIESSLRRSNFWHIDSEIKDGLITAVLGIRYRGQAQEGWMEIYELPQHQVDLLADLPVIEIEVDDGRF